VDRLPQGGIEIVCGGRLSPKRKQLKKKELPSEGNLLYRKSICEGRIVMKM